MNAAVSVEAAQLGLVQRTQKYLDAAALKLVDSVTSSPSPQSPAPPSRMPPVEPTSAPPREGSSLHVVA